MSGDPHPEATELRRQRMDLRDDKVAFRRRMLKLRAVYSLAWDVVRAYGKAPEAASSKVQELEHALSNSDRLWDEL